MTKISLRVYNREIEAMIEGGQVDEAIAHCQNILYTYPMHLESYRLLGKAFLEARRFDDAADIFQRVIMAVPDDFVSHVGMSIIRDDEGKLDESIWHMERAFEVQPSNPAIQDELRKLYGRRDGVQPPKVRLTRDALANMYTQGALYSQAIAEIRAVLADDPFRPDLQVMLARAYSKDGRKTQAIEICSDLLRNYSFCFDALRILLDLMPENDPPEIAKTYRQRICALDPYAGFASGSIFNSDKVADAAVSLELLDYDPRKSLKGSQPGWGSSLGIKLGSGQAQPKEPVLEAEMTVDEQPDQEQPTSPGTEDEKLSTQEGGQIPDWMLSSGWEKTAETTPASSMEEDTPINPTDSISKADIPEWLKELVPQEEVNPTDQDHVELPSPMIETIPGNGLDELQSAVDGTTGFIDDDQTITGMNDDVPEWLKGIRDGCISQPGDTNSLLSNEPAGDWMDQTPPDDGGEGTVKNEQPEEEPPAWLNELIPAVGSGEDGINGRAKEEELPEWLREIGSGIPKEEIEIVQEPERGMIVPPDEMAPDQDHGNKDTSNPDDLPDWLKEAGLVQEEKTEAGNLETMTGEESETIDPGKSQADVVEALPEPSEKEPVESMGIQEKPGLDIPSMEASFPSPMDQEAALAWLESLALKHGANSNELLTKPEDRQSEPPEWVQKSIGNTMEAIEPHTETSVEDNQPPAIESPGKVVNEKIPAFFQEKYADLGTFELGLIPPQEEPEKDGSIDEEPASADLPEGYSELNIPGEVTTPDDSSSLTMDNQENSLNNGFSLEDYKFEENVLNDGQDESKPIDDLFNPESDVSNWLEEMESRNAIQVDKSEAPVEVESVGDPGLEPLPDWLMDYEKESTSTDWIPSTKELPENLILPGEGGGETAQKISGEVGEIQVPGSPAEIFEDEAKHTTQEPLVEYITPVSTSEWQPMQPQEEAELGKSKEAPKPRFFTARFESLPGSHMPGTGILSKIPSKDVERESVTLEKAQNSIESGDLKGALDEYGHLIKKGQLLENVIHDLREITYQYPIDIFVWQILGDAYMRANQLQAALDAYTKAEELLR
jgi:tetratricopeptide (TPR) repeat protein